MKRQFIAQYSVSKKLTKYVVRIFYNDIQIVEIYNDNIVSLKKAVRSFCKSVNNENLEQLIKFATE